MFATATVKSLREIAALLEIQGRSTMVKADLLEAINNITDAAHTVALEINAERNTTDVQQEREAYVTVPELLALTGWKRLPRKYKKFMRKAGHLA